LPGGAGARVPEIRSRDAPRGAPLDMSSGGSRRVDVVSGTHGVPRNYADCDGSAAAAAATPLVFVLQRGATQADMGNRPTRDVSRGTWWGGRGRDPRPGVGERFTVGSGGGGRRASLGGSVMSVGYPCCLRAVAVGVRRGGVGRRRPPRP